jgi:hypothetical protein
VCVAAAVVATPPQGSAVPARQSDAVSARATTATTRGRPGASHVVVVAGNFIYSIIHIATCTVRVHVARRPLAAVLCQRVVVAAASSRCTKACRRPRGSQQDAGRSPRRCKPPLSCCRRVSGCCRRLTGQLDGLYDAAAHRPERLAALPRVPAVQLRWRHLSAQDLGQHGRGHRPCDDHCRPRQRHQL